MLVQKKNQSCGRNSSDISFHIFCHLDQILQKNLLLEMYSLSGKYLVYGQIQNGGVGQLSYTCTYDMAHEFTYPAD